jgi:predicted dehydrogenase
MVLPVRALLQGRWEDGLLDYHRPRDEYRIEVTAWLRLAPVGDVYFVRQASLRLLVAYFREIGVRETARKVMSRIRERRRNEKYVSCGVGRVLEGPRTHLVGERVVFVASFHPACVERIVVPAVLLAPAADLRTPEHNGWIVYRAGHAEPEPWKDIAGWSPHSGIRVDHASVEKARQTLEQCDWSGAVWLRTEPRTMVAEESARRRPAQTVLFGYGNYAKTTVLPNVRKSLRVDRIHELDPTQIGGAAIAWDTAPVPRKDEAFDICLVAGYHHTHAPLAVHALERGAAVVLEKPIATTLEQLEDLLQAMKTTGRPLYVCFQRRYLPFNELALEDLGAKPGDPISYDCVVYEESLPLRHWYRWPVSGSRLVSNGCHWIDHFLHLNGFPEVVSGEVERLGEALHVSLAVDNGATLEMELSSRERPRGGVEDCVHLHTSNGVVQIDNASRYSAGRTSRHRKISRSESYRRMYREIAMNIARGATGDSARSVDVSARAVLELEAALGDERRDSCKSSIDSRLS